MGSWLGAVSRPSAPILPCLATKPSQWLSLDRHVSLTGVASVLIAAYVAFYLQRYLGTRAVDRRAEKKIFIRRLRMIDRSASDLGEMLLEPVSVTGPRAASHQVLRRFRRISNDIELLRRALKIAPVKGIEGNAVSDLQGAYLQFKEAATGTNFPSRQYAPLQVAQQAQAEMRLKEIAQEMAFRINRAP